MGNSTLQESSNTGTISLEERELFHEINAPCEVCTFNVELGRQISDVLPARWIATLENHGCRTDSQRVIICDMHRHDRRLECGACGVHPLGWTVVEAI